MAFVKDKTGSAQTAANAAAVVVAAFADGFDSFDDAVVAYNELRADIFADLATIVDADNEKFAANDSGPATKPARSGGSKPSGGSKSRASKSGGGSKRGGGSISLDDALNLELSWGAFEGETLGTVLGLSAQECDDTYGYGEGERNGRDYLTWLASDSNNVEFVQKRARVIADAEGIDY